MEQKSKYNVNKYIKAKKKELNGIYKETSKEDILSLFDETINTITKILNTQNEK